MRACTCSSASARRPIVQLYADGFERCRFARRMLVWHLTQAAIAGRDIYYDQRYAHNLDDAASARGARRACRGWRTTPVRRVIRLHEAVLDQHRPVQQPDGAQVRAGVHARTRSTRAVHDAVQRGARLPAARGGEPLDALLARLRPLFFDRTVDPIVTNKTPGEGRDILEREREQPLRRRHDGRPRRRSRSATR